MTILDDIFKTKPDFVNDTGIKWWVDKACTQWAREKNINDVALPDVVVFLIEEPSSRRTRVIVENGEVVFDNQNLEAIGAHIDIMKLQRGK